MKLVLRANFALLSKPLARNEPRFWGSIATEQVVQLHSGVKLLRLGARYLVINLRLVQEKLLVCIMSMLVSRRVLAYEELSAFFRWKIANFFDKDRERRDFRQC